MSYEFKKYQTRTRIVNAAQLASGDWQLDTGRLPNPIIDAETFAAHYEPVPEPPAGVPCRCDVEMFGRHCDDCPNAWAEARQERERSAGRIDPQRIAQTNHNIKEQLKTAAPHRATIAMIPCSIHEGKFQVMKDGDYVSVEGDYSFWCGTEAEAKAKRESLRGENNGTDPA